MSDVDVPNSAPDTQAVRVCSYLGCGGTAPLGCTLCPLHYLTRRLSMAGSRAQRLASDLAHGIPAGDRARVQTLVRELYASIAELEEIEQGINR